MKMFLTQFGTFCMLSCVTTSDPSVIVANFSSIGFGSGAPAVYLSLLCVVSISVGTLYQKRFCASVDLRSGTMIQLIVAELMMWWVSSQFEDG